MSDDSLIREVNEELRREQMAALWDKYGTFVLGGAFLIVASVAGYKGWQYWTAKQAAESGEKFVNAQILSEDGKTDEAQKAFQKLAEGGPKGYQVLAKFRLASSQAASGETEQAIKTFDELAKNSNVDQLMQGYARIQAAFLLVDKADLNEMTSRLGAMTGADDPWRHSARELIGLAAYRNGKYDVAEKNYNQILSDPNAPENLRKRAETMLSLILNATTLSSKDEAAKAEPTDKDKKPDTKKSE